MQLFDNKIQICAALMLWTLVSCSIFCFIMVKDGSNFLTLGPNAANQLLGVKMDTWFKWWVTAIYTFVSTARCRATATRKLQCSRVQQDAHDHEPVVRDACTSCPLITAPATYQPALR